MPKRLIIILLPLLLLLQSSCNNAISQHSPAKVSNVYELVYRYPDLLQEERWASYESENVAVGAYARTFGIETVSDSLLLTIANTDAVRVFTPDAKAVYGDDCQALAATLGMILDNASGQFELPERYYAAVVYGLPESILFVDSVMLVALNHYLGADYPGYSHLPAFLRASKTPAVMPYDLAEALLGNQYPYCRTDNSTLLSRMLYEGVLAHAKQMLVDGATAAAVLGYDEDSYKSLLNSEKDIWRGLVEQQLLYDTSPSTMRRLILPMPSSTIGTMQVDGRVGRFIGYRILESYLREHQDAQLRELLNQEFYNSNEALNYYKP